MYLLETLNIFLATRIEFADKSFVILLVLTLRYLLKKQTKNEVCQNMFLIIK